jgi:transposase
VDRTEDIKPTHLAVGLDVGLESFYTDTLGNKVENPRFYRTGEKKLKRKQRLVSRKVSGSSNRNKAKTALGKVHLKISRQRKDHALKLARCVITSNDVVVYEDLRIKNLVKNHCLAKSINDAGLISIPTPRVPYFWAAVMTILPSPLPRSYKTSFLLTLAIANICSATAWGVGT